MTDEGFGYDPQRGELWFAGEAAEAVLLELETRRRELDGEVAALQAKARQAESDAAAAAERAAAAEAAYAQVAHLRTERAAKLAGELARVGGLEHEARRESARANERAAAAELERARLGGEGQIRLLQVDESSASRSSGRRAS